MILNARFENLDALSLRVRYLRNAARTGLKLGVSEAASIFETEAKELVPVKTGALRDSIQTETIVDDPENQQLSIAPHTPYAARVEFGFVGVDSLGRRYHQIPEPYMRPVFDALRDEASQVIKDSIFEQMDAAVALVSAKRETYLQGRRR
jgi:hypothetical protein